MRRAHAQPRTHGRLVHAQPPRPWPPRACAASTPTAAARIPLTACCLSARVRRLHLRWAVSQAEERVKEAASDAAGLVAERDQAMGELHETAEREARASSALAEAQQRVLDLEASLLAERSNWASRACARLDPSTSHAPPSRPARRSPASLVAPL